MDLNNNNLFWKMLANNIRFLHLFTDYINYFKEQINCDKQIL